MSDFDDRDIELLSAYLDSALTEGEAAALEARLRADTALRADLDALRQTVALVRSLPRLAAPRSFALTAEQAGLTAARPRQLPIYLSSAVSALSAAAAVVLVALAGFLLLDAQAGALPKAMPLMVDMAAAPTSVAQAPAERLRITALPTLPSAASAQGFEGGAGARAVPSQPQAAEDSAAVSAPEAAVAQPQPTFAAALTATAPPEIALGAASPETEGDQPDEESADQRAAAEAAAPPPAPAETPPLAVEVSPFALLAGGLLLLLLAAGTTLARGRARRRL